MSNLYDREAQRNYQLGTLVQFIANNIYEHVTAWLVEGIFGTTILSANPINERGNILKNYYINAEVVRLRYEQELVGCIAEVIGINSDGFVVLYLPSLNLYTQGFEDCCFRKVV